MSMADGADSCPHVAWTHGLVRGLARQLLGDVLGELFSDLIMMAAPNVM